MNSFGSSFQCKVRQCYHCQGDTEFYCNTCIHDLCLQCKEKHVIDLDTISHDVVIYCEKYNYISKQETCKRHPENVYKKYCCSCKLPVCSQCKDHNKHLVLNIRAEYQLGRRQSREIIQKIRSEIIYNSCFLLARIKIDMKKIPLEIANLQSEISLKAETFKRLTYIVISEAGSIMIHNMQQLQRNIKSQLASIENYESRYQRSLIRPVKFLLFLKKNHFSKIKNAPKIRQQALLSITGEINMGDVIQFLSEMKIIETGKRQIRNESLLKLMSEPVLHKSITVAGYYETFGHHISCVTSDRVWVSVINNGCGKFILTNTKGETLYTISDGIGAHTVTITGELIYIDRKCNIKLYKNGWTNSTLITQVDPWYPECVYCSPINGDLLVGMYRRGPVEPAKVVRYSNTGQHIQTIQHDSAGQTLYKSAGEITENRNGDIVVSDSRLRAVVVTDRGGSHRFSYTGPPSGEEIYPCGICTDALSHILVCDISSHTVQMMDKDGRFLSLLLTQQHGIGFPWDLSYDHKTKLLWGAFSENNRICIYRYIERKDNLTYDFK